MTDHLRSVFGSLGLEPAEIALYLALLEGGPSSIRTVASRASVNRGKAYESLKRLVTLGLASVKRVGERDRFVAESPDRIYDLIQDRRHELEQLEQTTNTLLPSLLARGKRRAGEPIVRFYENDDGVATILRDVLATLSRADQKMYRSYSSQSLRQYLYRRFPDFTRRRIAEEIFVKVIAIGHRGDTAERSERRELPSLVGEPTSSYVIIYGDKVAMISLSANNTPYGVVIEEPGAAATQRLLFETLWQSLPAASDN